MMRLSSKSSTKIKANMSVRPSVSMMRGHEAKRNGYDGYDGDAGVV